MDRTYFGSDDVHFCKICGKQYNACDSCDANTPFAYRELCDTKPHYDIQQAIAKFYGGKMSKEDAAEALLKCDLSDADTFLPNIRTALAAIIDPPVKKKTATVEIAIPAPSASKKSSGSLSE